jgi:hypothetical protein
MNLLGITDDLIDFTNLSGSEATERNQLKHVCNRV